MRKNNINANNNKSRSKQEKVKRQSNLFSGKEGN
jgi:hypothetical protein